MGEQKRDPFGGVAEPTSCMPGNPKNRKNIPLKSGCIDYFPAALCGVAMVSKFGNDKHNPPGTPLTHNRDVSGDEAESVARHLAELDGLDPESGLPSSWHALWRLASYVQKQAENNGWCLPAPAARWPSKETK